MSVGAPGLVVVLAASAEDVTAGVDVTALTIGLFLLIANAFFVGAEIALLAARRTRIEVLAEEGDRRAQRALKALRELSVTFSGAQLGITMCSLGLGAIAEPAVAGVIVSWLGPLGLPASTAGAIAFAIALTIVVFLHMVLGEMVPKNLALAGAEQLSLRLSRLFGWFVTVFRPLIVALNATANALVRLTGTEPVEEIGLVHTPDELQLALRESRRFGQIGPIDARVLTSVLALAEIDAEAAMTPRVDVVTVDVAATVPEILEVAASSGYTRLPVRDGDLDNVVGLVHVKDLLIGDPADDATAADVMRPMPAVPETRDLEHLLVSMRDQRAHVVLVVDEYGGTAGVLTLEDVIEELVGDIADEFDADEGPASRSEGAWVVPGTFRRDELERLTGMRLPDEDDAETISGVMTAELGRLVRRGDEITHADWTLRVLTVEGRRAGQVEVIAPRDES